MWSHVDCVSNIVNPPAGTPGVVYNVTSYKSTNDHMVSCGLVTSNIVNHSGGTPGVVQTS